MREILFRGKRIDNGEWVEGFYHHEKVGGYLTAVFIAEPLTDGVLARHRVDPSTVGQYTGLTDENGKRIFEGDIITASVYEREYEYEYLSNTPIKVSYCGGYFYPFHLDGCWRSGVSDIEIIGNIHDNPELMEVHHDSLTNFASVFTNWKRQLVWLRILRAVL